METTTVTVRFTALPAHVRTARLVAAAVARRSGVGGHVLDEVRLAVGEACSRAVDLHRRHCPGEPVTLSLTDGRTSFTVEVHDRVPEQRDVATTLGALADAGGLGSDGSEEHPALDEAGPDDETLGDTMGLAVIVGLVDDLTLERGPEGLALRMTWPLDARGSVVPD